MAPLASQSLILRNPLFATPNAYALGAVAAFAFFSSRNSRPKTDHHFCPKPNFYKPHNLTLPNAQISLKTPLKPYACSSNFNPSPLTESTRPALTESPENPTGEHLLTASTRTVSTLVATGILVSKLFGHAIANYVQGVCKMPSTNQLLALQGFRENMMNSTTPLLFAAIKVHRQQLQTPWTIIAWGLAKCIEVYMAVLGIRCALAYFPNVEWNTQPYVGLRDLSDPFLLLFQGLVPPVFNLDMSITVAFIVLSIIVEILKSGAF